ncbi:MAG TPA: hypothetical protein VM056_04235 [Terriglobales bacterium]|nr:hypothetical protein [Terriglobales bacterium]
MSEHKESMFAEVARKSQEKRSQADRRAVNRRAAESLEISKQIASRKREEKAPATKIEVPSDQPV